MLRCGSAAVLRCCGAAVLKRRPVQRHYADADLERVLRAAEDDAAQRAHVAVVAAPGEVTCRDRGITSLVGSRSTQPMRGTVDREPGVRRVGADQPRLAGRRIGQQVAAHVAGGQAERAQARDLHVREVLADAVAIGQHARDRRRDRRRRRIERELAWMRCIRSIAPSSSGRPGGNASRANAASSGVDRDVRRRVGELRGLAGSRRPCGRPARRATASQGDARVGIDVDRSRLDFDHAPAVTHISACGVRIVNWSAAVAEVVGALADLRRRRARRIANARTRWCGSSRGRRQATCCDVDTPRA